MQKLILMVCFALLTACSQAKNASEANQSEPASAEQTSVENHNSPALRTVDDLYKSQTSHVQTEDKGVVVKVLKDDTKGLKHQKFLVKVASGQTVLFAHNLDLAPRVEDIKAGDEVGFRGEYIYNPKGGVVHWTHHDPSGKHFPGWIKHNGHTYE